MTVDVDGTSAIARFWPIMTNVERKIASSETTRVRVGDGPASTSSIQTANVVIASAIGSFGEGFQAPETCRSSRKDI